MVNEDDKGGADEPSQEVHEGKAEDGLLEDPLLLYDADIEDETVGEDGEEAAESHDGEHELEEVLLARVGSRVGVLVVLAAVGAAGRFGSF